MCPARGMSSLSSRVSTAAAAATVVLLTVLLVVLWTGISVRGPLQDTGGSIPGGNVSAVSAILEGPGLDNEVYGRTNPDAPRGNDSAPDAERDAPKTAGSRIEENITVERESTVPDLEYVRLRKISENVYEDPPDESATRAERHHSGHFRLATAEVWDPHPQYEFTAFGRQFRLMLAHDASFVSPDIKVTRVTENTTRREGPGQRLGCFYRGVVDGDPESVVTVSLCHGMTGHVRTSTGSYFIKPTEEWHQDTLDSSLEHAIQRAPTRTFQDHGSPKEGGKCAVIDYGRDEAPVPLIDDSSGRGIYVGRRTRSRRSLRVPLDDEARPEDRRNSVEAGEARERGRWSRILEDPVQEQDSGSLDSAAESWRPRRALHQGYFIQVMVVADAGMTEYHGDALFNYILVLMSTVSRIYKDQSVGNPISVSVINIVQTDEAFGVRQNDSYGIAATETLKRFCQWQKRNNPDDPSPKHHDTALLLTRETLCHHPKRCDTLGLAELGRVCSPDASCTIVHDNGLATAFTIAHEIGHVLNMPHDDDPKCSGFREQSRLHKVMFRMLDENVSPWEWSRCSRHYVTEFLEAGHGNCLLDEPRKIVEKQDLGRLPGEDYTEDEQCQLVFGEGSKICPNMVRDVCKCLWCMVPGQQRCHTQHMPWADGTKCGEGKWCLRGECVPRRRLEPVDGQWGRWGKYGECSRSCGGGVKRKVRRCDNPPPLNGGNYCVGDRVRYKSCGTKECPKGSPDFRQQQCSRFDHDNRNIQNLTSDVTWRAKYTRIPAKDRCRLFCQAESKQYYMLRDKVVDGTPCGPDTFHICVNGQCRRAGCDHVLDSNAELDTCGVCRGDNSTCQRITGTYNQTNYGYNRVTKIPAGSSYIDIRQHGWMDSHNDSNYLALRLEEDGEYILNGKFVVNHQKVIVYPGITIEYSGPEPIIERLNSSRPIGSDLIVEVLSVDDVNPPQITYEYTVPKRILNSYTWVLSDWSDCSRTCQGMKYRRAECRSTRYKDVVSEDYCRLDERPLEESQMCNSHCLLQWQVTSTSECSAHCGPGTRSVSSQCIQILTRGEQSVRAIPAHACAHIERPADQESCIGPCNNAHWSYTEWRGCSVSCGGGVQMRSAVCVDSNDRPVPEESCAGQKKVLKRICGQDTCPKWSIGDWSPCSVTCGVGKRQRQLRCHIENRLVPTSYCGNPALLSSETCDAGPCQTRRIGERKPVNQNPIRYSPHPPHEDASQQDNEVDGITFHSGYKWQIVFYRECSRPCIDGMMTRTVNCVSAEAAEIIVPDDYCDKKKKPATSVPCDRHQCPKWSTGDWSQCNVKCGSGLQHRQIGCQSPRGEILKDEECLDSEKPQIVRLCKKSPCQGSKDEKSRPETNIVRRWNVYNWSPCSNSCGTGVQRRRVECRMRRGSHSHEVPVKDEHCSRLGLQKPKTQRPCRRLRCETLWQESPWSECSKECGEGVQTRAVTCHRVNAYGWIDPTPTQGCPLEQKPPVEQSCKLRDCTDLYYWTTGPWKKCNHMCGRKGRQSRRLFCQARDGRRVAHFHCSEEYRPKRKRKCNQRQCDPVSCLDLQKRLKTTKDGEYSLVVGGRQMTVYCHGMDTAEPKEYLTLPAGDQENYAEIYDKRLMNPQSCPYNGQRNDSCYCATDAGTISGKTMFRRLRFDPVKLYIIANDYTFSWTKGAKRVEYGKAGDCYSLVHCPQGRFSINLDGTLLKLSSEVAWTTESSRASLEIERISDQRVLGKCGGYCGFCKPKTGLKLDVLPP